MPRSSASIARIGLDPALPLLRAASIVRSPSIAGRLPSPPLPPLVLSHLLTLSLAAAGQEKDVFVRCLPLNFGVNEACARTRPELKVANEARWARSFRIDHYLVSGLRSSFPNHGSRQYAHPQRGACFLRDAPHPGGRCALHTLRV